MSVSELPAGESVSGPPPSRHDWKKARLPSLSPSSTAEEALADIVLGCVDHLRGNERCVLERLHEEGIHQMRVAVRRLRSCVALYERWIPEEQRIYLTGELKWLIGELGPARDWDVFAGEIMAPVARQMPDEERLQSLLQQVERHRDEAYARAQAAVGAQRYIGLVLLLSSWAEGRGWREPMEAARAATMEVKASEIAQELLHSIYERLAAAGADFEKLDPRERHKVRIQLKKLRYATEFFSSLYAKRRVTPYLTAMKSLQDQLGNSNDVDVAKKLLKRVIKGTRGKVRAGLAYAAGLVVGWHSHVGDDRERELIDNWQRFVTRAPYWETAADTGAPRTSADGNGAASGRSEPVSGTTASPSARTAKRTTEKIAIPAKTPPRRNAQIINRS